MVALGIRFWLPAFLEAVVLADATRRQIEKIRRADTREIQRKTPSIRNLSHLVPQRPYVAAETRR
jgi:hypothetical protein